MSRKRPSEKRDHVAEIDELTDVTTALAGLVTSEVLKMRVLNAQGHTNWTHHGEMCRLRDALLDVLLPCSMTGEENASIGGEDACKLRLLTWAGKQ